MYLIKTINNWYVIEYTERTIYVTDFILEASVYNKYNDASKIISKFQLYNAKIMRLPEDLVMKRLNQKRLL